MSNAAVSGISSTHARVWSGVGSVRFHKGRNGCTLFCRMCRLQLRQESGFLLEAFVATVFSVVLCSAGAVAGLSCHDVCNTNGMRSSTRNAATGELFPGGWVGGSRVVGGEQTTMVRARLVPCFFFFFEMVGAVRILAGVGGTDGGWRSSGGGLWWK